MTQIFAPDGATVGATLVQIPPAVITQIKTKEKDGYAAVQVGTNLIEDPKQALKKINKPQRGHTKSAKVAARKSFEFRLESGELVEKKDAYKVGDYLGLKMFTTGDLVKVSGTSKGRGFAGVVKRHHFAGGPASHGHKDNLRAAGAIGSGHPQHVLPGTRMAGHPGAAPATVKKLKIFKIY